MTKGGGTGVSIVAAPGVSSGGPKGSIGGGGVERGGLGGATAKFSSRVFAESARPVGRIDSFGNTSSSVSPRAELSRPGIQSTLRNSGVENRIGSITPSALQKQTVISHRQELTPTAPKREGAYAQASEFSKGATKSQNETPKRYTLKTEFISLPKSSDTPKERGYKPVTNEDMQSFQQQASEQAMQFLGSNKFQAGQEAKGQIKLDRKNNTVEVVSIDKPVQVQTNQDVETVRDVATNHSEKSVSVRSVEKPNTKPRPVDSKKPQEIPTPEPSSITYEKFSVNPGAALSGDTTGKLSSQEVSNLVKQEPFTGEVQVVDRVQNDTENTVRRLPDIQAVPPAVVNPMELAPEITAKDFQIQDGVQSQVTIEQKHEKILQELQGIQERHTVLKHDLQQAATAEVTRINQKSENIAQPNNTDSNKVTKAHTAEASTKKSQPENSGAKFLNELRARENIKLTQNSPKENAVSQGQQIPTSSELVERAAVMRQDLSSLHKERQLNEQVSVSKSAVVEALVEPQGQPDSLRSIPVRDNKKDTFINVNTDSDSIIGYANSNFITVHSLRNVGEPLPNHEENTDKINGSQRKRMKALIGNMSEKAKDKAKSLATHAGAIGAIDWDELLKRKKKKSAYEEITQKEVTKPESKDNITSVTQRVPNSPVQPQGVAPLSSPAETVANNTEVQIQKTVTSEPSVQAVTQTAHFEQQEIAMAKLLPQIQPIVTPEHAQQLQEQAAKETTSQLGSMVGTAVFKAGENGKLELILDKNAKHERIEAIISGVVNAPLTPEGTVTGSDVVASAEKKHTDPLLSAVVKATGEKEDGGETTIWNSITDIGELSKKEMLAEALKREEGVRPVAIGENGGGADERDLFLALSKVKKNELKLAA